MTEPQTPNIGLISPNTGDLSGTWGSAAINPNNLVVDGYQGGSVGIAVSNANVTLSTPAGFTPAPSAGPTQSQNARIQITGALSANVALIFTLPGYYIVENLCSNIRTFGVQLRTNSGGTAIGAIPGKKCHVFCDGINLDYVNLPDPGTAYDLHGWGTYPPWMLLCTNRPYLIKDGSSQLVANYPNLFNAIGYAYGGAGPSFNLPDEMARVRVGLDIVGTNRITNPINASVLGAAGGAQALNSTNQLPQINYTPSGAIGGQFQFTTFVSPGSPLTGVGSSGGPQTITIPGSAFSFNGQAVSFGSANPTQALPPLIVSCLPMIKT